jgi:hypothetical protein
MARTVNRRFLLKQLRWRKQLKPLLLPWWRLHPRETRETQETQETHGILEGRATPVIEVGILVAAVKEVLPGTASNPRSRIC